MTSSPRGCKQQLLTQDQRTSHLKYNCRCLEVTEGFGRQSRDIHEALGVVYAGRTHRFLRLFVQKCAVFNPGLLGERHTRNHNCEYYRAHQHEHGYLAKENFG